MILDLFMEGTDTPSFKAWLHICQMGKGENYRKAGGREARRRNTVIRYNRRPIGKMKRKK